jgi:membrane protease subunit HflC
MKRNSITLLIGLLLVVIFALLLFTFQVRTTAVAVVTTFGKPTRSISDPGLYGNWPWPIQKVYTFDKRVQTFEDKFTEDYTSDKNTLLTSVYIGWRITDPKAFFPKFAGGSVVEAEKILSGVIRHAKSAVVGNHPLSDFVSVNSGGTNFVAIENEMLESIRSQVRGNNYGIGIEFLGINKLGFPETVTQDIFAQMTSERQILISQLQRKGEAQAQIIKSDADRRANEMLAAAKGTATEIKGQSDNA